MIDGTPAAAAVGDDEISFNESLKKNEISFFINVNRSKLTVHDRCVTPPLVLEVSAFLPHRPGAGKNMATSNERGRADGGGSTRMDVEQKDAGGRMAEFLEECGQVKKRKVDLGVRLSHKEAEKRRRKDRVRRLQEQLKALVQKLKMEESMIDNVQAEIQRIEWEMDQAVG